MKGEEVDAEGQVSIGLEPLGKRGSEEEGSS